MADGAVDVQHVEGGPALDIPPGRDWATARGAVPPGTPGNLILVHRLLEFGLIPIAVDAEENERFAVESFHERSLLRVQVPGRPAPISPKIEQHDLASIVAQLELLAVKVLAFDLWRRLADGELMNRRQFHLGPGAQRASPQARLE